jgi:photosystem II stability/assembly factor-like uncharacterized protein
MRRKADLARNQRSGRRRRRTTRLPGGKALQRLFTYLGQRDPALNDDIVARVAVPKKARPNYALTSKALRAKPLTAASAARARRRAPEAQTYAAAIVKAAAKLTKGQNTRAARRKMKRAAFAAPPVGPPGVWQAIGPSRVPDGQTYGTNRVDVIGRVSSIAVDPNDPKHLLLGAAGGGIWESTDTGATWTPRTDQMPSLAIGAIAFHPTASSRVYAGSGEGNFYSNLGVGVYKSTNGGTTWTVLASAPFVGVGFFDLVVDPISPTTLYAATTNGFYKSTNGGVSWSMKRAGMCWDVSVHPRGGSVELLATFGDGLFVSTNSGNSFTAVPLPSPPSSAWLRLAVDRVTTSPDIVYVFGAAGTAAFLWRRVGTTWTKVKLPAVNQNPQQYDPNKLEIGQAQYDWYVAAPANNIGRVFIGAIDAFRGTLSGSTWQWQNITTRGANSIHPDQHCLTFAPDNTNTIYAGNDGGIYRSADSGATWKALNKGLGICEIEYLASDPNTWQWLIAGTQDNGTMSYTGSTVWNHVGDGDGGDCGVNQLNPNIVYHSYYDVSLERSANKGSTWTDLNPPPFSAFDSPPTSLFYPPVEVSGLTVAIGAKSLVVTRSGAAPWTSIPLGLAAGELPSAMREIDANTLLVVTTKGRVLKMTWNGTTWTKAQLASPASRYISCIAVDPSNSLRFWVTISQIGAGAGLVYRSDDAGNSWVNRTAGLPNIPMNAVVVDPGNFKRVWVAADVGVYQTLDLGTSWTPFSNGLPNAMAVDLLFHKQDRTLICATRNRGAWVMPVP